VKEVDRPSGQIVPQPRDTHFEHGTYSRCSDSREKAERSLVRRYSETYTFVALQL